MKKKSTILMLIGVIGLWIFPVPDINLAMGKDLDYPTKPINFYIAFGAGGTTDLASRGLIQAASKYLGQTFVPINKPGAGGTLTVMAITTAAPDGYRLGSIAASSAFVAPFSPDAPYKDLSGLTMIMNFGTYVYPVMVRADAPWKNWKEFIEWARKNPKAAKIGITGSRSVDIKGIFLWRAEQRENVEFTPVAFKGSTEVLTATLGGHINVFSSTVDPSTMPYLKEGKLRVLTYLGAEKIPGYENIPSIEELYGFSIPSLLGVCGPKGLPENVLRKLGGAFAKAVKDPEFVGLMNRMYTPIVYMNNDEMNRYVSKTFLEMDGVVKKLIAEEAKAKK